MLDNSLNLDQAFIVHLLLILSYKAITIVRWLDPLAFLAQPAEPGDEIKILKK